MLRRTFLKMIPCTICSVLIVPKVSKQTFWSIFGPLIFSINKRFNKNKIYICERTCPHCGFYKYETFTDDEIVLEGQNTHTEWGPGWEGMFQKTCKRCGYVWEFFDGYP